MQRGGKWDNTDVKGARNQKRWLGSDKEYASGGFKKEQSMSIFGGANLPWATGKPANEFAAEKVVIKNPPKIKFDDRTPRFNKSNAGPPAPPQTKPWWKF